MVRFVVTGLAAALVASFAWGAAWRGSQPTPQEGAVVDAARARQLVIDGMRLAQAGQLEQARDSVLAGLELIPDDADAHNLLGEIYDQLGDSTAAAGEFRRAMEADPTWSVPQGNLGLMLMRSAHFEEAVAPLERATTGMSDNPLLFAALGFVYRNLDRMSDSIVALRRAHELDPENGPLALDLAVALRDMGNDDAAIPPARVAAAELPENFIAQLLAAELLSKSPDDELLVLAPAAYRQALQIDPDNTRVLAGLADTYFALALYAEAEGAQRRLTELQPDLASHYFNLAQTLNRQSEYQGAADAYAQAVEIDPNLGWAYYFRGEVLFNLNRVDDALESLGRAIDLLPGDPDPILAAVNVLTLRGEFEKVERYLDQAMASGRRRVQVLTELGRLRLRQGRATEAVNILSEARRLDPSFLETQYLVGQALVRIGEVEGGRAAMTAYQQRQRADQEQRQQRLREGLEGRPYIHTVRAKIFRAEGRYEEAINQLEAAFELVPENREIVELLAVVYEEANHLEDAERLRAHLRELEDAVREGEEGGS